MAAIIEEADDEAYKLLSRVMTKWHKGLVGAGVNVKLWTCAVKEGDDGPALKLHGVACLGTAKIVAYEARAKQAPDALADAEIKMDLAWWKDASEKERVALLDHECSHFELAITKDGTLWKDDLGRQKLKTRQHDYDLPGVFMDVVHRHEDAACEVQAFVKFKMSGDGQFIFGFEHVG